MNSAAQPHYDLAVAYRVYPVVSRPARSLPFGDDKYLLAETCLRSFKESLGQLRVKMWVLLDSCPTDYERLFRRYFDPGDLVVVPLEGAGNGATFSRQIDILLEQTDCDVVYFAEDDYFYLPGQFHEMLDFLATEEGVDFVSPHDHPDCYTLDLHCDPKWLRVSGLHHWRTAASTCLTFLTRKQSLARHASLFRTYARGNFDCSVWLSLTKKKVFSAVAFFRYLFAGSPYWKILAKAWLYGWRQILFGRRVKLWVPVPGIATHLDANGLSPGVDWIALMEQRTIEQRIEVKA
jgi:hypothetical protein